jgi:hypothetical protein
VTWAEAFAVIERGGRVKRSAWAGNLVLVREPVRVVEAVPEGHPLHGFVNAVHHWTYLLQVDTLTGEASPFVHQRYADIAADDWHEVLT